MLKQVHNISVNENNNSDLINNIKLNPQKCLLYILLSGYTPEAEIEAEPTLRCLLHLLYPVLDFTDVCHKKMNACFISVTVCHIYYMCK